jgi:uncharacterized cupredoxin-like copper-binding protein
MTKRNRFPMTAATLVAAVALFTGPQTAGAHSDMTMPGMQQGYAAAPKFTFGEPGKSNKAARTVTIAMTDGTFEPSALEVKVGETIRFVVTNTGELDHDFTLGDAATEKAHRAEMAEMAEKGGEMQHDDPNAVVVKPGETKALTWKFTRAGRLEFDCDVPGHYEAGMAGTISVMSPVRHRAAPGTP